MNKTIQLIENHMSIRKYKKIKINREIVELIVKCAQMAPSTSNFQNYTIIEVENREKIEFLFEISGRQTWIKEAPLVLMFCADLNRGRDCFTGVNPEVFGNSESFIVSVVDTSLAMQKAFLAAQSLCLGGVVVGGIRNEIEKVAELFNLPELVCPLYLLCLGYPDEMPGIKPRLPIGEVFKIDDYDSKDRDKLISSYNNKLSKYYSTRTNGKNCESWSQRCGRLLMEKTRENVGEFIRMKGFLQR